MSLIDLHVHSTASDGSNTPSQLISLAHQNGVSAFALTDHDTIAGVNEAVSAGKEYDIEVVPGIELSAAYGKGDIHLLGLFVDYQNEDFIRSIEFFANARARRNEKMIQALCDLGFPLTMEDLRSHSTDGTITRMHFAVAMLEKGYISDKRQAFDKYIGNDCAGYVPRELLTPAQAIDLIHGAGGISILAHPYLYGLTLSQINDLIDSLCQIGLMGVEAYYWSHSHEETDHLLTLAHKYHLGLSGGSDFHGAHKPHLQLGTGKGNLNIPYEVLLQLKELRNEKNHKKPT